MRDESIGEVKGSRGVTLDYLTYLVLSGKMKRTEEQFMWSVIRRQAKQLMFEHLTMTGSKKWRGFHKKVRLRTKFCSKCISHLLIFIDKT